MKCSKCGTEIPDDSRVCPACGEQVETAEAAEPANEEFSAREEPQRTVVEVEASPVETEEASEPDEAAQPQTTQDGGEAPETETPAEGPEDSPETRQAVQAYQGKLNKLVRPVRTGGFFFTELLLLIPVINVILLFVWAFRKRTNLNRKAFARSILIWILIVLLLVLAGLVTMIVLQMPTDYHYWISRFKELVNSIPG